MYGLASFVLLSSIKAGVFLTMISPPRQSRFTHRFYFSVWLIRILQDGLFLWIVEEFIKWLVYSKKIVYHIVVSNKSVLNCQSQCIHNSIHTVMHTIIFAVIPFFGLVIFKAPSEHWHTISPILKPTFPGASSSWRSEFPLLWWQFFSVIFNLKRYIWTIQNFETWAWFWLRGLFFTEWNIFFCVLLVHLIFGVLRVLDVFFFNCLVSTILL